ncbi:uncharacterized protein MG328 homolog [Pseudoliparis swirei]|uniref:uncharacterized protein MG328 homolog n=1 Tax=Pseudoliparis swirei TaxID=2059687 RepID=UPI0024BD9D29|nr:uncharacterized protein MG328 homolog [Pseudoliparis swirei]
MDKNKTTLDQTLKIGQEEKVGNIGTVVTKEELAEVIQAWRTKPLRKDLCRAKASVRALTEMDNNGIKMDNTLNIEEKFENIRINLINTAGSVYQEDHLIGEMQLPEGFAQNCIIHDQKVNISEDAQKIQAWRSETLEKDLCGAKASVPVQTELMENNKITFDKILNLERLEIKRLTVENEKLRKTPALKNTSDQETLNIYHQKTEKLKKDLWKWKQRAPDNTQVVLEEENTALKTQLKEAKVKHPHEVQAAAQDLEKERNNLRQDLHAAQVNIKEHLETIASLKETVNRMPLGLKATDNTQAPANTQVVLEEENTFLKTELKEANLQHRRYAKIIADMTQQSTDWILEVQDATKDLENERITLRRDLHAAQVNIKDLLATNASLDVAVNRVPLDQKAPDNTQIKEQQDEANALAESLCRWKQRVTAVTQEKTSLQTALHTAQHKIKDQLALEKQKTSLQSELHTAQLKIKEQQDEANSLAESLCSWKQIVTAVTQEKTSLERELHTAQHQIKAQLALEEQNTSLQSELHTAQHQLKAQLALEEQNTSLQSELHTAQLKIKEQQDEANALAESLCRWKQRVTGVTQEKTSLERELHTAQHQIKAQLALEEQNTSLQSELHTAQLKIKEQLESIAALNEKVQQHPLNQEAAKDQETLKIYQQKTEKLKKDLWKWKQRVASLQGELHGAQVNNKELLETIAALSEMVKQHPLNLEAAESTNLVLEEEKDSLQAELKRAEVQNQIYERTISDMTEEHHVLILETQVAAHDLESGRNSLQKDLQTAEANNNDQLEAIAALTQTMNQKLLELEGARLDLDQKTATIEEQNIMFEDIRREKEAEENNKLPLEQEDTSLLQATEILQQPEISNRPRGKKWYQKMNPFHKHQRKTKG